VLNRKEEKKAKEEEKEKGEKGNNHLPSIVFRYWQTLLAQRMGMYQASRLSKCKQIKCLS
jgi:hypothetical protein